jgi:hypothetical protein
MGKVRNVIRHQITQSRVMSDERQAVQFNLQVAVLRKSKLKLGL